MLRKKCFSFLKDVDRDSATEGAKLFQWVADRRTPFTRHLRLCEERPTELSLENAMEKPRSDPETFFAPVSPILSVFFSLPHREDGDAVDCVSVFRVLTVSRENAFFRQFLLDINQRKQCPHFSSSRKKELENVRFYEKVISYRMICFLPRWSTLQWNTKTQNAGRQVSTMQQTSSDSFQSTLKLFIFYIFKYLFDYVYLSIVKCYQV